MTSPAKRLIMVIAAIGLVVACENPAAPGPVQSPTGGPRFDVDPGNCLYGYNVGQGRCNDST